jgi:catechol 2,3-dioxygenase-like lactoylglutathione lyase family enzyme
LAQKEAQMNEFASATVDVGMVVSNTAASAKFYKDALGLTEVEGFDVPAAMGRDSGLSDNKPFRVRVFLLSDAPTATKLKMIQFPDAPGRKIDNSFIHSSLGVRYLTIWIADTTAAMARLKKANVKPLAKCPCPLPESIAKGIYLIVVRDPDGNLVELVGPKK